MKTHPQAIQAIAQDPCGVGYLGEVVDTVGNLFSYHEIKRLSGVFSDAVYYLSHPELACEFDKQTIIDFANESILLLGNLSDLYDGYRSLEKLSCHE